MKKTVKIFRWSESRNQTVVSNGTFDNGSKATFSSIEMKRIKAENNKNSNISWRF